MMQKEELLQIIHEKLTFGDLQTILVKQSLRLIQSATTIIYIEGRPHDQFRITIKKPFLPPEMWYLKSVDFLSFIPK